MTTLRIALCILPLIAGFATPAAAAAVCEPPAETLRYRVVWGGDEIGRHELSFVREGNALLVRSRTEIDADMMFMDLLDLSHEGEEVWRDGRMERYRGRTIDNDEVFDVTVEPEGDGYRLTRNGRASHIPSRSIPGSLWCESTIGPPGEAVVIDLVKGRLRQVRIDPTSPSVVDRNGRRIPARRHQIVGGYDREVWFAETGVGLRARFPAKMGPSVVLELE